MKQSINDSYLFIFLDTEYSGMESCKKVNKWVQKKISFLMPCMARGGQGTLQFHKPIITATIRCYYVPSKTKTTILMQWIWNLPSCYLTWWRTWSSYVLWSPCGGSLNDWHLCNQEGTWVPAHVLYRVPFELSGKY